MARRCISSGVHASCSTEGLRVLAGGDSILILEREGKIYFQEKEIERHGSDTHAFICPFLPFPPIYKIPFSSPLFSPILCFCFSFLRYLPRNSLLASCCMGVILQSNRILLALLVVVPLQMMVRSTNRNQNDYPALAKGQLGNKNDDSSWPNLLKIRGTVFRKLENARQMLALNDRLAKTLPFLTRFMLHPVLRVPVLQMMNGYVRWW